MDSEKKNGGPGGLVEMLGDLTEGSRKNVADNVGKRKLEVALLQMMPTMVIANGDLSTETLLSPETRATVEQISQDLATLADTAPKLAGVFTEMAEVAKKAHAQIDDRLAAATSAAAVPIAEETPEELAAVEAESPT